MAHWRDGGIGNMAGSDDRPIEEWTLLERLNNFEAFFYKTEPDAETIQMLTRRAADVIAAIPQWQPMDTALIAELREKVIVGGGYADVSEDELERLIALIPLPAPKVEA